MFKKVRFIYNVFLKFNKHAVFDQHSKMFMYIIITIIIIIIIIISSLNSPFSSTCPQREVRDLASLGVTCNQYPSPSCLWFSRQGILLQMSSYPNYSRTGLATIRPAADRTRVRCVEDSNSSSAPEHRTYIYIYIYIHTYIHTYIHIHTPVCSDAGREA